MAESSQAAGEVFAQRLAKRKEDREPLSDSKIAKAQITAFGAFLAFVALVGGCSVGPRYKAPSTTIRPFHNPAPMRADGASAPPLDTWWEGFGDPELTRIVQRALDQNPDLAAKTLSDWRQRSSRESPG